jgi:nitrite reductase/ring-hydroxylating ferredoxin subunit/DMSO/TMAO reductase YedYZ heme-binding membrane subunit
MSASYQSISWNTFKKKYDLKVLFFILSFLFISILSNLVLFPKANIATVIIRSFGLLSIVLLHVILSIGPLCRINPKFLPLLYNRRHLGVMMFIVVSIHACISIFWFHGNGNINPILSVFTSNTHYDSFLFFPFQTLGFAAYIILLLMAFTSHDFWLAALSPKVWKSLHMLVYVAYFLVVLHVVLGILQFENNPIIYLFIFFGLIFLSSIHIWAGIKSYKFDQLQNKKDEDGWHLVCHINEIENNKAKMINVNNERIAIFKYDGKLSAVHNVCKHQNGPLGEGMIIDGCITCPWHGYQYHPEDGCSPAPFTEKVGTYQLKLNNDLVYVNPTNLGEGTFVEPLQFTENKTEKTSDNFFIGWLNNLDKPTKKALARFVFPAMLIGFIFLFSFTLLQKKIANAVYRYNEVAEYTGFVSNTPFPHILFTKGKDIFGNPVNEVLPLVNAWKFGADSLIDKWCNKENSRMATLTGTIIVRDSVKAMELTSKENSFQTPTSAISNFKPSIQKIGSITIKGEIIDPKCYLGAMNPGEGKPHRSCAIRCISGGIMPMITYTENNQNKYAVLLGENGEKINNKVLDFVAEAVEVKGVLYKYENWNYIYINPNFIKRLNQ